MSMLSEQRRKTKWVVNPTKKPLWSSDSNGIKFGKQLMEKMGWSAGKGLGLKEQGIQEPLRVSFKNDTKGMGFKGNDDTWIEHQDEFNSLLNQLRTGEDSSPVESPDVEKNGIKSLEEKSKSSKARVHYQKFTRGKDLSKYSENDLACILGTNKMKKENPKTEEVFETETKTNGNCETSFGVTTINSGSLQDYFKKKWIINKNKSEEKGSTENSAENGSSENYSSTQNGESDPVNEEIKSKKRKHKAESEEQLSVEDNRIPEIVGMDNNDKVEKRKRKKKEVEVNSDNEPMSKKRRKNSAKDTEVEISAENAFTETDNLSLENENFDSTSKEKKKRKKEGRNLEDCVSSDIALPEEVNATENGDECKSESHKKKNKKRERKLKSEIENICKDQDEPDNNESHIDERLNKSKKNKKNRKENLEESSSNSVLPSSDLEKSFTPNENPEKSNCAFETDENVENTLIKKKKKKDKKEKPTEVELTHENTDSCLLVEEVSTIEEETGKKKKKKKEKKERLEENCYEENAQEGENNFEEPVKTKKKKKNKKEKIQYENETQENTTTPEEEVSEELVTKKKKKKKEKLGERVKDEDSSQLETGETPANAEKTEYENETQENTTMPEEEVSEELITKKKKKKKEKLEERVKDEDSSQLEAGETPANTEKNEMNSNQNESNPVNGVLSAKTEEEQRIEKLKVNLFGDGTSKKYFPQNSTNERVLKLSKWAAITEFKGANLRDVEGYGRRLMYQRQARLKLHNLHLLRSDLEDLLEDVLLKLQMLLSD